MSVARKWALGWGWWISKVRRPAPSRRPYFPLTSRTCRVYFASLNNPTCYYCLPVPTPHLDGGLRSQNADCMHGSLSHLDNPDSVQLGPFGWIQSLERCYTWPNRGSPAFTGAGVTQSVHLLHYGLDEAGFQSSQGQETFFIWQFVHSDSGTHPASHSVLSRG
jgi:hypothetical protein